MQTQYFKQCLKKQLLQRRVWKVGIQDVIMQSWLLGLGFFWFGLSACLLLIGMLLLDILQSLQALLRNGECLGGQFLGLEVEISQCLLGLVLLPAQEDDVSEFLRALLALCVRAL